MLTLPNQAVYEEEVKRSRFIAKASRVGCPEEALAFLKHVGEKRATRNYWAYKIGCSYRFSDDGEPAGTAGKPILRAIERKKIDYAMIVVVRYFGGTRLRIAGLTRAYAGCAARRLQSKD